MIEIIKVNKQDIPIIKKLAEHLWPVAFASILSANQIQYMMEMMYSHTSLEKQMNAGHQYVIARRNGINVGYMSYETGFNKSDKTKIHKLYISTEHQRQGVGKALIYYVSQQAIQSDNNAIFLNVNKHNTKAINFYNKHNFLLIREEEIDIGNGFIMDDFVFELTLNEAKF